MLGFVSSYSFSYVCMQALRLCVALQWYSTVCAAYVYQHSSVQHHTQASNLLQKKQKTLQPCRLKQV